jgi:hypothetical protein
VHFEACHLFRWQCFEPYSKLFLSLVFFLNFWKPTIYPHHQFSLYFKSSLVSFGNDIYAGYHSFSIKGNFYKNYLRFLFYLILLTKCKLLVHMPSLHFGAWIVYEKTLLSDPMHVESYGPKTLVVHFHNFHNLSGPSQCQKFPTWQCCYSHPITSFLSIFACHCWPNGKTNSKNPKLDHACINLQIHHISSISIWNLTKPLPSFSTPW